MSSVQTQRQTLSNTYFFYNYRPERFLLSDLMDWMHEVMHKTPEDWSYRRSDIRWDIKPLVMCAILQNLPIGLKNMRSPTLDKLERVSILRFVYE